MLNDTNEPVLFRGILSLAHRGVSCLDELLLYLGRPAFFYFYSGDWHLRSLCIYWCIDLAQTRCHVSGDVGWSALFGVVFSSQCFVMLEGNARRPNCHNLSSSRDRSLTSDSFVPVLSSPVACTQ